MFGFEHKKDIAESINLFNSAIKKEHGFKKYTDKLILDYIIKEVKSIASFISDYLINDSTYIHYYKKNLLSEIIKEFNHLSSSCKYYHHYSEFDQKVLISIISHIQYLFEEYSKYGSLYVFRHCEKVKRTDARGIVYDGIPTNAIKSQAMMRAKEIVDEILISPKKVKIILCHSEEKRTRLFGEIIIKEVLHHLSHCRGKVEIINKGYDSRIRFGYFSNEALNEIMQVYKQKGDFYSFVNWYFGTNEFKSFKLQPKPSEIIAGMDSFVQEYYALTTGSNDYTIVLGITHSWVIDAYLLYKITGLENQVKNVIETAGFFKVECGELSYLGKWVKI